MQPARLALVPIEPDSSFKTKAYHALLAAITSMDIYATRDEVRLDERQLAQELGISRTPIREALIRLEQEGFVRTVPRRGAFVVRKTKQEIIEIITVWAALESMAARLVTLHASDEEIATLRALFSKFDDGRTHADIDEYSDLNLRFHQSIIDMAKSELLSKLADNLLLHVRAIRQRTIGDDRRMERSIIDHMQIIEAFEARDMARAEELARQHALDLAAHVAQKAHYLD